jgi:pimeloyl-ACP methyl ester carboxylesterase
MPIARINKIDLYYESHGFGDPILCIPGLGSDANTWAPFVKDFGKRYRIVIVENRGAGRSSKPASNYSTDLMAKDAVALLEQLGIGRAYVVGKSMGGMIAQIIAARYPEKVRSVVLASTLMRHDHNGELLLQKARDVATKEGLFASYREAFYLSHSREFCEKNQGRLREVEALLSQMSSEEVSRGYLGQSEACEQHDSRALAKKIKAPALVIVGKDDVITTPQQSEELAAALPRSELVILPHGGHGFWREFPEEVNAVV